MVASMRLLLKYDVRRMRFLEYQGYRVLRFWNNDVLDNVESVLTVIRDTLDNMPSPNPSRRRDGSLWNRALRGGDTP